MGNKQILEFLEKYRDNVFENLKSTSISGLYQEQYEDIQTGRVVFDQFDDILGDLKLLADDKSNDGLIKDKLDEYENLDNNALIQYLADEIRRILNEIVESGKIHDIQALFIEYDFYYHYTSCVTCYGKQEYPFIETPRYITSEYDYNKQILFIPNGINFQPAWLSCEEFGDFDFLEIDNDLEELFKLHSRALLHKALELLKTTGELNILQNRPFSFYINAHDAEVMMLYRLP